MSKVCSCVGSMVRSRTPHFPLTANGIQPGNTRFYDTRLLQTLSTLISYLSFGLTNLYIMAIRLLEIIFFFYFASHIPITLFIDLQALLPGHVYPQPVSASTS